MKIIKLIKKTLIISILLGLVFGAMQLAVKAQTSSVAQKRIGEDQSGRFSEKTEWERGEEAIVRIRVDGGATDKRSVNDIMIIMDVSGSMTIRWAGAYDYANPTRMQVAIDAMLFFVDQADPKYDRLGLGVYSSESHLVQGLTSDFGRVRSAIRGLTASGMTSIGAGLRTGLQELQRSGDSNKDWYIILATDGFHNTSPSVYDDNILNDCIRQGIVVHTVGIGDSIGDALMRDIANQTGGTFYWATQPDGLADVYKQIMGEIAVNWETRVNDTLSSPYFSNLEILGVTDADGNSKSHNIRVNDNNISGSLGVLREGETRYVYIKTNVNAGSGAGPWNVWVNDESKNNVIQYFNPDTGEKEREVKIGNVEVTIRGALIEGYVWNDSSNYGIRDDGEEKVNNATLRLNDPDTGTIVGPANGFSMLIDEDQPKLFINPEYCWCTTKFNICENPTINDLTCIKDYRKDASGNEYAWWPSGYIGGDNFNYHAHLGIRQAEFYIEPPNPRIALESSGTISQLFTASHNGCWPGNAGVNLELFGVPSGVGITASLNKSSVNPSGGDSFNLEIRTTEETPSGRYNLWIRARGDCGGVLEIPVELNILSGPWFQSVGGNIWAGGNIYSPIPHYPDQGPCLPDAYCWPALIAGQPFASVLKDSPGFPMTQGALIGTYQNRHNVLSNIHHNFDRSQAWDGNARELSNPLPKRGYSYYLRKFGVDFRGNIINSIADLPNTPSDQLRTYFTQGNLTIASPYRVPDNTQLVVFVPGNLTISGEIEVPVGSFLAFIVKENITINASVGYSPSDETITSARAFALPNENIVNDGVRANVEGVYIADGSIAILGLGANQIDNKFIGAGTFVGWEGVNLNRNFDDGDLGSALHNYNPTETFVHRPDFLTNMPIEMKEALHEWREVQPGR